MILFFIRLLPHYHLALYRELNKALDAILCFGKNGPSNTFLSKVQPDFPHCQIYDYYPFAKKENLVIQDVITPLIKFKPDVIVLEFALSILSNWLLLLLKPFLRYKIILHSQAYNRKTGFFPKKSFTDKLKLWWMNRADAIIVYSQNGKAIISKYLNQPDKVFVGQNSFDTNKLTKLREEFEKIGKENIKNDIGFKAKYNLIYVGRLLKEKEPDRLIDVFHLVSRRLDSVALHIVGDGPVAAKLKSSYSDSRIKFWGTIIDDYRIGQLLFASDLMVIPGYLGLSIVHSFCFDIPVVSQKTGDNGPFHSREIEYLKQGKTGFLVEYGNNSLIAETITGYLLDNRKKEYMKQEIRAVVSNQCSFDKMIKGFTDAIDYARGKIIG